MSINIGKTVVVDDSDVNDTPVSRAEFEELVDAFLRLAIAVDRFNQGSPHKIQ